MKFLRQNYILIFIGFVSLALRLYQIGRQSYWLDEMFSVNVVMTSDLKALFWDNHPPLYHFVLKIWALIFGFSEVSTRSLSACISAVATIYLAIDAKKRGGGVVYLAPLLHAIMPLSIVYAQETRMYALFELMAVIQGLAFFEILRQVPRSKDQKFVVSSVLLLATHYLSVIILALQFCILFFYGHRKFLFQIVKRTWPAVLGLALYFWTTFQAQYLLWQNLKFAHESDRRWPWEVIEKIGFTAHLFFAVVLTSLIVLVYQRKLKKASNTILEVSMVIILGSLGLGQVFSLVFQKTIFFERYFIFLIPYFLWMIAADFEFLTQKAPKYFSGLVLVYSVFGLGVLVPSAYEVKKAPWRQFSSIVNQQPGSLVVTTRSLAIRYPYLIESTPVRKISIDEDLPLAISEELKVYSQVFVVENYLQSLIYFGNLESALRAKGFSVESSSLSDQNSEPLFFMKISLPIEK